MFFKNLTFRQLVAFLLLSCFIGCAAPKVKSYTQLPEINDELVTKIHEALLLNESKIKTIKAKASIKFKSPALRTPVRLNSVVRFKHPDSLRVITSKLTFTVFDMIYVGKQIWFNIPSEQKVYAGFFDQKTVVDGFGILFKPFDIINIFNFNELYKDNKSYFEVYKDSWIMHIMDSNKYSESLIANLYIDKNYNVTKYELFDYKGDISASIVLDYYIESKGCRVPQIIEISWPYQKSSFVFEFKDLIINQNMPDDIFQFSMPDDAEVIPIGDWYY